MNTSIINFDYKGSEISFMSGDNVMVNATQMAKPFNKSPKDFLKTEQTKTHVEALSEVRKILSSDLVKVIYGDNGGTWMHEDVALEFARWLSPAFAIWCNDRIKELLKHGMTATQPTLEQMVNNPDLIITLATQLKTERAEKERLEQQSQLQSEQLRLSAPKVKCYNDYISSDGTFTTTQIAKEYGWGAGTLNKKLKEMGIQYKQNGQWILVAKHDGKDYTKSIPRTYTKSDGTTGTQMQTVWTSKGREFIHSLFIKG